ncbi:hypothetical protein PIB30_018494 [Stylosanthes scabra]|uniref:Uncharacterized protein n=1 Tax=Stylosanthes scabra TaxID=79078 RepID=A0ABU6X9R5_9FABA|nr:hypothetical protein [Stylosanthes scabra]
MVNVGELEVGMPNGCQECKKNVLGCSMARRKSRASIELGVQKRYATIPLPSPRLMFYKIITVSLGVRGAKRTRCSAYGNSGPSGVIVYDRGRMIGPRGNTNDGYPVLVPDRSGLAMITDRVGMDSK